MEFGDNLIEFNILDKRKYHIEDNSVYHLDIIDDIVDTNVLDFLKDCDFSDLTDWTKKMRQMSLYCLMVKIVLTLMMGIFIFQ